MEQVLAFLVGAFAFVFTLYCLYDWSSKKKLAHIPGPQPSFFVGDIPLFKEGYQHAYLKLVKQYGRLFRVYEGNEPHIMLTDLDLIKQLVFDFDNFPNRPNNLNVRASDHLFFAQGAYWKKVRRIVSPTFTSVNLKPVGSIVSKVANHLVKKFEKTCDGKPHDISVIFGNATLDVIGLTAFDVDFDTLNGKEGSLVETTKSIFKHTFPAVSGNWGLILPAVFPSLQSYFHRVYRVLATHMEKFYNDLDTHLEGIVTKRKKIIESGAEIPKDLLSLMMDAKDKETGELLTHKELKDQCLLFLLAGYDTTSNVLTYTTYLLAKHPEMQEMLRTELRTELKGGEVTYDSVKNLKLLNMIVMESMRLYPPVAAIQRMTLNDVQLGQYHIPKGTIVDIPVFAIQRDPEYWPNPEKFDPFRFTDEQCQTRHALAHMTFGAGHRMCVGMRLAMMELKTFLAEVTQRFRFELVAGQEPLKLFPGVTLSPANGVKVIVSEVK